MEYTGQQIEMIIKPRIKIVISNLIWNIRGCNLGKVLRHNHNCDIIIIMFNIGPASRDGYCRLKTLIVLYGI